MSDLAKEDDYVARVNRTIDFIVQNPAEKLDLEQLARIAHFSTFHFHRIFKALVGETLAAFVKRVRLQRALSLMSHRPDATLTEIALACGLGSSSDFSRSFKQSYGVAPRDFDVSSFRDEKREQITPGRARLPPGENPDGFKVTLHDYPARFVAYVRLRDCFDLELAHATAERHIRWAQERGYAQGQWLGYMWDDPQIVPKDQCRSDLGVVVPHELRAEGEIGCVRLPPMKVARAEMRGGIELELRLIDWFYGTWLPNSSYLPDDQPRFEAWRGLPFAHGDQHFELALEVPIVERSQPL